MMILYFKYDGGYTVVSGISRNSPCDNFSLWWSEVEPEYTSFPFYTLDDVLLTLDNCMWWKNSDYDTYIKNVNNLIIKKARGIDDVRC